MNKPTAAEMAAELKALSVKATAGPWVDTGALIVQDAPDFDRPHVGTAKNRDRGLIVYLRNHALDFAEMLEETSLLGELLAVLHRDGGHHQSEVGTDQAVKDAISQRHALLEENERLKEQVRESQVVMQQFAHIYPDGFPGDWRPQPEHLASQVTFLCNHQQAGFKQLLDVIKRLEKAEAALLDAGSAIIWLQRHNEPIGGQPKRALDSIRTYFADHQRICEDKKS